MISVADLSVTVLALIFSVYAIFSALIFGISLEFAAPKLIAKNKPTTKLLKPVWELSNILLALGLTGFIIFFSSSLDYIREDIRPLVFVLAVAVAVRSLLFIRLCRLKKPLDAPVWAKKLLLLSSLTAPISLSAIGVYLIIGAQFWQNLNGWLLFVSSVLGLVAVGLVLVNAKRSLVQIVAGIWLLTLCCLWPLYLEIKGSHLLDYWLGLWLSFVVVTISLVIVADGMAKKSYLRLTVPALALITPIFLAAANNPGLVHGLVNTQDAFNTHGNSQLVVVALVGASAIAVYSLWYLAGKLSPKKLI